MNHSKAIDHALDRAIDFLVGNQLPTGQFKTYGGPEETLQTGYIVVDEVFTTSLVLYTLGFVRGDRVNWMNQKAVRFLLKEKMRPGVWRYWTGFYNGKRRAKLGWEDVWNPPDIEDTALISLALARNGVKFPRNRELILANRRADGLFYTWIVPRPQYPRNLAYWQVVLPQYFIPRELDIYWKFSGARRDDIDGGINANVLLYLGERPETQAAIDFLIKVVREEREAECCKWYRRPMTIRYFISRAHFHGVKRLAVIKDEIVQRVEQSLTGADSFRSPLEVAMSISTWLNFQYQPPLLEPAVDYLLATQSVDGSWLRGTLYGRAGDYNFGSEEITTGLCLEALARYRSIVE
jgi:hypothetical protein